MHAGGKRYMSRKAANRAGMHNSLCTLSGALSHFECFLLPLPARSSFSPLSCLCAAFFTLHLFIPLWVTDGSSALLTSPPVLLTQARTMRQMGESLSLSTLSLDPPAARHRRFPLEKSNSG